METAVKSLDGEHVKSGQKRKPVENKTPLAKKKTPKRELTHTDFMDLNNAKAAYVQSDSNGKTLTEHTNVLRALLMFHTVAKLKAMYKTHNLSRMPSTVKGDLVEKLTQLIMKKRGILRQDRIHSSTVTKNP